MSGLARKFWPYGVLIAQPLIFFRHVLFYGGYAIPWDLRYYHLPIASFIADSLLRGELPLWDPYTYCGMPIYAKVTAQLFYPPAMAAILLYNLLGGDLLYILEWQIVLHVVAGGVFTYALLRRLGAGRAAAVLGAGVFQMGGFFASQSQHLGAVNGAAWTPLAWLSVIALAEGASRLWLAALAASLAMAFLAGFPAVTAVVFASTGLLALLLVALRRAQGRLLGWVGAAFVWALLLSAAQLLPTLELTQLSVVKWRSEYLGTGGGLPLQSLVSLVLPNYYGLFDLKSYRGPWEPTFMYVYCGIPALALAGLAVLRGRRKYAAVFAALTAISALWMLGDATPVGRAVFLSLPKVVRAALYAEFALLAFVLGLAVLAGLGAARLLEGRPPVLGAALLVVAAADLIAVSSGRPLNTASLALEPGISYQQFEGSRSLAESVRKLVRRSRPPARIDTVNDSGGWALAASLVEVPTANGDDPFALIRLMQVRLALCQGVRWGRYYQVTKPESPVLDLLNVRYLLSRTPIDVATMERARLRKVADLPGRAVYENPEALPRFFLVSRLRQARDMEEAVHRLHAPDFDPRTEAVVEGAAGQEFPPVSPEARVTVLRYAPREVVLEVETAAQAFLATSEAHYPGWRAWLDGKETSLPITNVAFRGLAVPAGKHRIEMRFEPSVLWRGVAIGLGAWVVLAGVALAVRAR